MGHIDDQTRNNVTVAFTSILRGSPLAGTVNTQQAALALHTIFEHTEEGEPVDLGGLLFWLTHEAKAPEGPATEVVLVLKSREPRFGGVVFALPASCANLAPEQIESIVSKYNARGGDKGATYDKKAPEEPGVPVGPSYAVPKKGEGPNRKNLALYVAFGVVLLGVVGNFAYNRANAPPPLVQVTWPVDSAGLPCAADSPPMQSGTARCVIPKALYDKEGPEGIRARGEVTKRSVQALGVKKLYVITREDDKTRGSL